MGDSTKCPNCGTAPFNEADGSFGWCPECLAAGDPNPEPEPDPEE